MGLVGFDDAADLHLRPPDDGQDDVRALHLSQFLEDRARAVAEPGMSLPLLESLPEGVGQGADGDMGLGEHLETGQSGSLQKIGQLGLADDSGVAAVDDDETGLRSSADSGSSSSFVVLATVPGRAEDVPRWWLRVVWDAPGFHCEFRSRSEAGVMRAFRQLLQGSLWLVAMFGGCGAAAAQCAAGWVQGPGVPGVYGQVLAATVWDPDGPGPAAPVLVVAGEFSLAGTVAANRIAVWDPATGLWSALGSGTDRTIRALLAMPNGDLYAGGEFTTAGDVPAAGIARWAGGMWHPLGAGLTYYNTDAVLVLTALPGGDVVAGGSFIISGSLYVNNVARWNGTSWSAFGQGSSGTVYSLTTLPNGDVVAGGLFLFGGGGGTGLGIVGRWDGTAWLPLGSSLGYNGGVFALATTATGGLVAGGTFVPWSGSIGNRIARWNGASWSPLGSGMDDFVQAVVCLPNGDIVAAGAFANAGGVSANRIARWNGASWSPLGAGCDGSVQALVVMPNGDLVAAGAFSNAGGVRAWGIGRWNGTAWVGHGAGPGEPGPAIAAVTTLANGELVAAGNFNPAAGASATRIARWDGASWSPLGSGLDGWTLALAPLVNGDLVAGGAFLHAGGVAANFVARWNGTAWSPLGSGLTDLVATLIRLPNGDVVAGGYFWAAGNVAVNHVARWNGTTWSPFGAGTNAPVFALLPLPNGDLVAGGSFSTAGGVNAARIARWNGTAWSALPGISGANVQALATLADGELVAGGDFSTSSGANRIARWGGNAWLPLGSGLDGPVTALTRLPSGDLVAGGTFTTAGGVSANNLARWDGAAWSAFGSGTSAHVSAFASLPNGDLAVGGLFALAGGTAALGLARLRTPCPAFAVPAGAGCSSSVGPMVLTADDLPWVGGTFQATCTAIAANSLGFGLLGFTAPGTPLSLLHPAGGAGCSLLANPDAVLMLPSAGGTVGTRFALPGTAVFAGTTMFHQVLQLELGPTAEITRIGGSNGLALTIGSF